MNSVKNSKVPLKGIAFFFMIISICYFFFLYTVIIKPKRSQFTYNESLFAKQGGKEIVVAFRNDDLSIISNAEHEESVLNIFWKYGVKQTFAYIPKRGGNEYSASNPTQGETSILEALKHWFKQGKIDESPATGMTFVNTNAVLFPKANPCECLWKECPSQYM